jgi:hypothetical protein
MHQSMLVRSTNQRRRVTTAEPIHHWKRLRGEASGTMGTCRTPLLSSNLLLVSPSLFSRNSNPSSMRNDQGLRRYITTQSGQPYLGTISWELWPPMCADDPSLPPPPPPDAARFREMGYFLKRLKAPAAHSYPSLFTTYLSSKPIVLRLSATSATSCS